MNIYLATHSSDWVPDGLQYVLDDMGKHYRGYDCEGTIQQKARDSLENDGCWNFENGHEWEIRSIEMCESKKKDAETPSDIDIPVEKLLSMIQDGVELRKRIASRRSDLQREIHDLCDRVKTEARRSLSEHCPSAAAGQIREMCTEIIEKSAAFSLLNRIDRGE